MLDLQYSLIRSLLGSVLIILGFFFPGTILCEEEVEDLSLESALAKAEQNNPTLYYQKLALESAEITFQNAWDRMFLPKITLSGPAVTSRYTLGQLHRSSAGLYNNDVSTRKAAWEHGTPSGSASLNLGEYTLYNFGKDRDTYEIATLGIDRARQQLNETRRQVKFDVITKLYNFKTKQDLYDVARRSVEVSQTIYELIESRIPLKKAQPSDLSSAEVDLLNAQNILLNAQTEYKQALWSLNQALGDPVDHRYKVRERIRYLKFKTPLEELIATYKEKSPSILDAKLYLDQAQINTRLTRKNGLPLPAITFSGVSLGYNFTSLSATPIRDTTSATTSGNINISASINFTLPLMGEGGLFGARNWRAAEIAEEQAALGLRSKLIDIEISLRTLYTQILQQESAIENHEKIYEQSSVIFEETLKRLQSRAVMNRLDLKNSTEQIRSAEQNLTSAILQHYSLVLQIAQLVGVDSFHGEEL